MTRATSGPMWPTPFAFFDPESSSVRMSEDTFDLGLTRSSPTLPAWGSMRGGVLYGHPTPVPLTAGRGSGSLLKTPNANNSLRGRLRPERLEGPRFDLQDQVGALLATPTARDHKGASLPSRQGGADLVTQLLPTPTATQGRNETAGRAPGQQHHNGTTLQDVAYTQDFGPYTSAVRRWEMVLGRPAPPPTIQVDDKHRLNPAFVEWMQGLPDGWVTGVEGVSRSAALKMLGNGVVPQQALLALSLLDTPYCLDS